MRFARYGTVIALCVGSGLASLAYAAPISIVGGFTSFTGPVATATGENPPLVRTTINGTLVYADEPLPGGESGYNNYGIGFKLPTSLLGANGDPVDHVEFTRDFFSVGVPNLIKFVPNTDIDVQVGDEFKLGTFILTNGSWFGNSPGSTFYPDTFLDFELRTVSADPALDGHVYRDTFRFVVTAPTDPAPELDADYFTLVGKPELGALSVFEAIDFEGNPLPQGNTGTIDFYGRIGSLIPTRFANATGGAFLQPSDASAVPEPASLLLLLGGLLGMGAAQRLRRRDAACGL